MHQYDMTDPRGTARAILRDAVPDPQWVDSRRFLRDLLARGEAHPLFELDIRGQLARGSLSRAELQRIHLDYRYAIVDVFTDILLAAQLQTRRLESTLGIGAKMAPRFLLTLNVLDEFGFAPGDSRASYLGNARSSHYSLYLQVLADLELDAEAIGSFEPSEAAERMRGEVESSFDDLLALLAILIVGEQHAVAYSPPLRLAVQRAGLSVDVGYYQVHGSSDDEQIDARDDVHLDDALFVLTAAMRHEDRAQVEVAYFGFLDRFADFWTHQASTLSRVDRAAE